ncbi:thiamineS protein [Alkaliphilus metalliredigens QYMF]|uniref:ThiamineS protein n=1 Tax=Alkaliphilus metalliredigens (strain QYMF) TaxID=293826 RepID=A6TWZ5_ALKMQ|nr:MoaD/ThiS family protein [Alkaliphilus metalliredigens]ABR50713.1 thiamineS protein [Alkaliphilus metalliredigens QYMF]
MEVKVRLFATLRDGRGKELMLDLPGEVTPERIINELDIPQKEIAILLINGRDGTFSTILKEEDTVSLFPPVGGG